jgi:predicted nuclease of predicted toxin-antitoxin system
VKFVIDAQLPPSLAAALRDLGCDAVAVRDIGLREAKDPVIWRYALQNQAAIITKDEDFAERCSSAEEAPVVIWLRIGNATNPDLLDWLLPLWPAVVLRIEAGDKLIEVR